MASEPDAPRIREPPVTMVAAVEVLFPLTVSVPAPDLVKSKSPLTVPVSVRAFPTTLMPLTVPSDTKPEMVRLFVPR